MRVFVYEYTCAAADRAPPALRAEGWAMLAAVAEDLNGIEGVRTVTLLGPGEGPAPAGEARRCGADEEAAFAVLAGAADYTLVIAPEFDGILADRCRRVLAAGGRLLGPSPEAVETTADKLRLAALLTAHGVPTPACAPVERQSARERSLPFPTVLKARFGAGSQAVCVLDAGEDVGAGLDLLGAEAEGVELLQQPLVPGRAASVALLIGASEEVPLPPAYQSLSADRRLHYLGGVLPVEGPLARRAAALGRRAVRAVPGLRGYVGVDLVLGDAEDGSADWVIEINPRLTTSYVGLRALARDNLAAAMLRAVRGEPIGELAWHPWSVHFQADGTVRRTEVVRPPHPGPFPQGERGAYSSPSPPAGEA